MLKEWKAKIALSGKKQKQKKLFEFKKFMTFFECKCENFAFYKKLQGPVL
jgi:hypothetical protein